LTANNALEGLLASYFYINEVGNNSKRQEHKAKAKA
jgi:hypothetical protein